MQTLTITVIDSKAIKLLEDLESLNLIRVIKPNDELPKLKLSERLYRSLSEQEADQMHRELIQMRSEWGRDI